MYFRKFISRNIFISYLIKSYSTKIKNMSKWEAEKQRFLEMPMSEKKKLIHTETITSIGKILPWHEYFLKKNIEVYKVDSKKQPTIKINKNLNETLVNKVSVWQGDITTLEIDAIVNAANSSLRGGGGVDGAIHRAAGSYLLEECISLNGCPTGEAKITGGYLLPAKYVIHTVGPQGEKPKDLEKCYNNSLAVAAANNLRTIGFPSISTGIYGYPMEKATHVALRTVRTVLEANAEAYDRIIFVVFSNDDLQTYERLMQLYFPVPIEGT